MGVNTLLTWTLTFLSLICLACSMFEDDFEGDCSDFKPKAPEDFNEDLILKAAGNGLFIPMASKLLCHGIALLMDGTFERESQPDYTKMCPRILGGSIFNSVHAFGNKTMMECLSGDPGIRQCSLATARVFEEPDGEKIFPMKGTIVWTDKKSHFLAAMCLANKVKLWMLMSSDKEVDDATKAVVEEHIVALGFTKDKAQVIPYKDCKIKCNNCKRSHKP